MTDAELQKRVEELLEAEAYEQKHGVVLLFTHDVKELELEAKKLGVMPYHRPSYKRPRHRPRSDVPLKLMAELVADGNAPESASRRIARAYRNIRKRLDPKRLLARWGQNR